MLTSSSPRPVLYVNGQSTDQALTSAERLGHALGLRAKLIPRWGELFLQAQDGDVRLVSGIEADPTGVVMSRVASTMRAIEDLGAGRLAPAAAKETVRAISEAPVAPDWLFTLAAAAGAAALAVIFGVEQLPAVALIFVSAALGGILRRGLAVWSTNVFLQPFSAALLAGVIGGVAVRLQLSSSLRLVAVCPCMVLVPGTTDPEWRVGFHQGPCPSRYRPHDLCRADHCGDLKWTAARACPSGRFPAGRSGQQSRAPVARHDRRRHRCRRLQRVLFHPAANAALASGRRHAGPRSKVVVAYRPWLECRNRSLDCLSDRRIDPHSCRAASAHAVCGYRLRFCRVDDSGCLPIQDGERPLTTWRGRAYDIGADWRRRSRTASTAIVIILAMSVGLIVPKMAIDRLSDDRRVGNRRC